MFGIRVFGMVMVYIFFLHKHMELSDFLYKITPLAGLLEGTLISFVAYKITRKKIAFLLPIFFFIKRISWCIGFVKAHLDSYGHIEQTDTITSQ